MNIKKMLGFKRFLPAVKNKIKKRFILSPFVLKAVPEGNELEGYTIICFLKIVFINASSKAAKVICK